MGRRWLIHREEDAAVGAHVGDAKIAGPHLDARSPIDALAEDLLLQGSRLLELRLAQQQLFLPQFQQVLPTVKVARFFQIANKLDVQMRMEMSQKIPLVE